LFTVHLNFFNRDFSDKVTFVGIRKHFGCFGECVGRVLDFVVVFGVVQGRHF
jgi:hypothetical protein